MWLFKKKQIKELPVLETAKQLEKIKKERFDITIILGNGKQYGYNQTHNLGSGKSSIKCFLPFYKWFYGRESPYFTFIHSQGADIFIRDEIKTVSMRQSIIEE